METWTYVSGFSAFVTVAGKQKAEQATFATDNYFPEQVGLEFRDFIAFFKRRKEVL